MNSIGNYDYEIIITQTELEFREADIWNTRLFERYNCTEAASAPLNDICEICESRGFDCDQCPFTEFADSCALCTELGFPDCTACQPDVDICTECNNLGFEDCDECPLTVKLIRPQSVKVEYNHADISSFNTPADKSATIKVTENSLRVVNDQLIKYTKSERRAIVGTGAFPDALLSLTHVMEIDMTNNWVNENSLDSVIITLESKVIAELNNAGITNPSIQQAFATSVSDAASKNWNNTTDAGPAPTEPKIQNPDLFALQLVYSDEHVMVDSDPQFNGNIAGVIWSTPQRTRKSYSFTYDPINRLTVGHFQEDFIDGLSTDNRYGVNIVYEDGVGNIRSIARRGAIEECPTDGFEFGIMDALTFTYKPDNANRLDSISEAGSTLMGYKGNGGIYDYDANGNITHDGNKNMDIEYNHLNLPRKILFLDKDFTIEFSYDAAGNKLRKTVNGEDSEGNPVNYIQDYVGGIEYRDGEKEAIYHSEGRVSYKTEEVGGGTETTTQYEYYLKDHLGNVRVAFADRDGDGYLEPFNFNPSEVSLGGDLSPIDWTDTDMLQENHYYPFGMEMNGMWENIMNDPENDYLYNGKEYNEDLGLNWYDYGARYYDPSIGRFTGVDRFAEKYSFQSPYAYAANNPIKFIDVNGDSVRYANASIKAYVSRFASETIINRKGKVNRNANYNAGFAALIKQLDASKNTFVFTDDPNKLKANGPAVLGEFTVENETTFNIVVPDFSSGGKSEANEVAGGRGAILAEETFHATQFENGELTVARKRDGTLGLAPAQGIFSIPLEIDAKIFVANSGMAKLNTIRLIEGYSVPTMMGIIKSMNGDRESIGRFLMNGTTKTVFPTTGGTASPRVIHYSPSYSEF